MSGQRDVSSWIFILAFISLSLGCKEPVLLSSIQDRVDTFNGRVAEPTFSLEPGKYSTDIEVVLTSNTEGATIHCTVDGSTPTASLPALEGSVILSGDDTNWTVKAIAIKDGLPASKVVQGEFSIDYNTAKSPISTLSTGMYFGKQIVSLECEETENSIYFTVDGSDPRFMNGILYEEPIQIACTLTLRFCSKGLQLDYSAIVENEYIILPSETVITLVKPENHEIISLEWSQIPEATSYYVTCSSESNPTVYQSIYNGSNTFITHTNLSPSTKYNYKVRGQNSSGLGIDSEIVSATTFFKIDPPDFGHIPSGEQILRWNEDEAGEYTLRVADSIELLDDAVLLEIHTAQFEITPSLPEGTQKFWQIRKGKLTDSYEQWNPVATFGVGNYEVGDNGPAGGIIVYDKGSYTEGWRFLEMSTANLTYSDWGYGGTINTSDSLGEGMENCLALIAFFPDGGCSAVETCMNYSITHTLDSSRFFDDWFLPSVDEATVASITSTVDDYTIIWTSTVYSYNNAYAVDLYTSNLYPSVRSTVSSYVRPFRRF